MSRTLTKLPQTQFAGLDANNILNDVANLVSNSPDFSSSWDDFLSSDAGRMLTEIFAYIADNLATRIDWNVNENWISTATQTSSVMKILKILGYNFTLPYSAGTSVTVTVPSASYPNETWPGNFYLTSPYNQGQGLTPFSLSVKGTDGALRNFEALSYGPVKNSITNVTSNLFDYKSGISVGDTYNGVSTINFYDGTTYVETFTATTDNAYSFTLNKFPVIQSSPRVYLANDNATPPTETELLLVPSFLYPQAQSIGDTLRNAYPIPYTLSVGDSNKVTVSFGTNSLLPSSARRPVAGDKIRVFYRVGGGTGGNIVSNAINTTQLLTVTPLNNITTNIHVDFQNKARATGGQDAETSEHATTYAPLSLRTVQKAVTAEDYDILLNENSNVWTAVSYGLGNAPSNVYSKYGVNIQPTEVWNYVVTKKISPTTLTNPINTTDYNNLYWMSYYLDNRFNEIYSFRPGGFNFPNTIYTSQMLGKTKCRADSIYYRADTKQLFRNYFYLNSATDMINSFVGDTKFKVKVTTSYDTTQQFTYLSNLVVPDTIYVAAGGPGCYLGDTYCKYRVTKYIQSYLIGSADLSAGVDLSTNKFIKLNIDNIGDTVIDLTRSVVSSVKNVHAWEIAASINSKLNGLVGGSHPYGANYGDSTGVKGGATVLKIGSGNYLKIQGYNTGSATADSWISTVMIKIPSSPVTFPDATLKVFGTEVSGDTYVSFGYNRLTLIKNNSLSQFGNIVYENGSVTLGPYSPITFYTHYIKGDTLAVRLGTYFNYNFPSTDINYRPVANRVYNTVNITGDSKPNVNLSTFQLKFTSAPTISPSLYSINNSWNIFYATPAYITGPTIGDTVTIGAGSNNIKIGIDGKADVTVNLLADGGTFGKYYSSKMADTINAQLKLAYSTIYSGDSYAGFSYAFFDSTYKRITLKSPFASNASKVKIGIQSPGAGTILFGTVNTINNYAYVNGDYYLKYNATVSPTTSPCGAMELIKTKCADTNIKYSRMPDANFYTHFLWDRRSNQSTDEYAFQKYLLNQKMTGITNVFKPPIFGTFDIAGNIYYNQIYSFTSIKNSVETAITNAYGFVSNQVVNRDFNKSVNRSEIENLIHATEGVQYVTLTYFGTNLAAGAGDSTNKTNVISCDFDQIIVLAQNQFSGSNQIHGMAFNYYPYTS